ncbi:hypothetical protein HNP84_008945 [Thermocatellispora tengchongensis]|uniref:Septum formation-related domain-containing protein n=1 Tax=Thermocatellispora tengchongensis TaxID=1073253 RepID=A0A840PJ86_9ACTN|nr:hypothetical protein [Thermocatellispora tengchongensis]MBB5139182.1 hypothetical protein [Thermocatellispora tengchongensis]
MTRRWGLIPAIAALGTLFIVPAQEPAVKTDAFITAETSGILLIEGGECFSDPAYDPGAGEPIVLYTPCAEGADNQSFGFVHVPDGPYDRAALAAFAWRGCGARFAELWGDSKDSSLDYYPIMPTAETWADGDRDVMCAAYRPSGRLTGSVLPAPG